MTRDDVNSTETLRVVLAGLRAAGLRPERELQRMGVPLVDGVHGHVHRGVYCAFWDRMVCAAGREDLGLEVARRTERGSLGVLEWFASSAATVGEGLEGVARYGRMLHSGGHYELALEGDEARFSYHAGSTSPPNRPTLDWSFAYLLGGLRRVLPAERPLEVRMQYARPADAERVEEAFEAPVSFDAPLNEIVLPRALLEQPLATRDGSAYAALETVCRARAPEAVRTLRTRVEAAIIVALQREETPTIGSVARRLGTSVRSLQRGLLASGVSFRDLVLDGRMQLARRWLAQPGARPNDIAYRLSYSEPSAFLRAYRAHFGARTASDATRDAGRVE